MKAWKPWQIVLLVYLLTLNLAVFGILAYYLLRNLFSPTPPISGTVTAASVKTPAAVSRLTVASIPEPIEFTTPAPIAEEKILEDSDGADRIPPVNIPPALPSGNAEMAASNLKQADTPTPSPPNTYTPQPTSTPTPASLPTNTPRPTATAASTASPTNTATATPTATSTPRPTATPTQTATPRPSATSTPTRTPQPTATPTRTPTPLLTNTPTTSPTPISSATPLAVIEGAVSAVASTFSGTDTNLQLDQSRQAVASEPGLMEAVPLTNGGIALNWPLAEKTQQYRIYSDMGTGYGVYIYKALTTQPTFIDEPLRSGMAYNYRLTGLEANQEVVLAQVKASPFANDALAIRGLVGQPEVSRASVVAAPTALPSDAILLGLVSANNFTDDFNTLTIVGELRNDSHVDVGQTDINITFYDAAGAVIGTTNGQTMLKAISPGEKSPFLIALTRPAGFASYSIRAVGRPVSVTKQSAQLSVVEVRRYEDEAGFFHIEGVIQNTGSTTAKRVKVAAIIYGRDHGVINVGFTYVNPPTLAPGEQATYEVVFAYYPRYLTQQVIPFEE